MSSSARETEATIWKWFMVQRKLVAMRNVARQALGMLLLLERAGMEAGQLEFADCMRENLCVR